MTALPPPPPLLRKRHTHRESPAIHSIPVSRYNAFKQWLWPPIRRPGVGYVALSTGKIILSSALRRHLAIERLFLQLFTDLPVGLRLDVHRVVAGTDCAPEEGVGRVAVALQPSDEPQAAVDAEKIVLTGFEVRTENPI